MAHFDKIGYGVIASGLSSFDTSTWYHVLMTLDVSGNTKLYLNGEYKDGGTGGGNVKNSDWALGRNGTDNSSYFNGKIDDFKIWNYALTSEQVKNEYNGGAMRFE